MKIKRKIQKAKQKRKALYRKIVHATIVLNNSYALSRADKCASSLYISTYIYMYLTRR